MKLSERIEFVGHPNILGTHRNTIELTRDSEISKRADCVIGVSADKACADLDVELKHHIQSGGGLIFAIGVNDISSRFRARGSPELALTDKLEIVIRRSSFSSARTVAVSSEAAASDLPKEIIQRLRIPDTRGYLLIEGCEARTEEFLWSLP